MYPYTYGNSGWMTDCLSQPEVAHGGHGSSKCDSGVRRSPIERSLHLRDGLSARLGQLGVHEQEADGEAAHERQEAEGSELPLHQREEQPDERGRRPVDRCAKRHARRANSRREDLCADRPGDAAQPDAKEADRDAHDRHQQRARRACAEERGERERACNHAAHRHEEQRPPTRAVGENHAGDSGEDVDDAAHERAHRGRGEAGRLKDRCGVEEDRVHSAELLAEHQEYAQLERARDGARGARGLEGRSGGATLAARLPRLLLHRPEFPLQLGLGCACRADPTEQLARLVEQPGRHEPRHRLNEQRRAQEL
mmetsp:Transcript_15669/g.36287  ORF Transcript_15669/g.36287 Transcript_15669/m.36287 type:complete len:311 (+) Transcript_15669:192-1124(+)